MPKLVQLGVPLLHGMIGNPLVESGRGCDLVDDDEEYGNTPRRDICDNSGAEGLAQGNKGPEVQTQILLSASSSWDGEPYQSYPSGQPELSVLKITLASHAQLEWHSHPLPSAAYIVAGELTLERKRDGKKQRFTAGQAISETIDTFHNRGVAGNDPVVLIVFYAGRLGMPLTQFPSPVGCHGFDHQSATDKRRRRT